MESSLWLTSEESKICLTANCKGGIVPMCGGWLEALKIGIRKVVLALVGWGVRIVEATLGLIRHKKAMLG